VAARVERPLQVHVDHGLEVVGIEVEERAVGAHTRVRHRDLEAAEALDRPARGALDRCSVAHVALDAERRARAEVVARRDSSPTDAPASCSERATGCADPRRWRL
jgi:hypothetical protein